ncbi:MAG: SDR family oxidoreductase [Melioribacteraceae bacterium]|nr:SDR family oxidoreductase [Melioribacteraceae bacterium]
MNLNNKYGNYALITGASSGIGECFARRLAELGMNLVLVARRKERLDNLKREIQAKHNVDIINIELDLTEDNIIEKISQHLEGIDVGILINNAGYGSTGYFHTNNADNEILMVKLNCVVPTILTHHFIRPMVEKRKGAVIFLGSVVALQPTPLMSTYSATKVFNAYLGESLWYEMKRYNVDVLNVNPGGTVTEFQRVANVTTGPFARRPEQVVETALNALGKKPSVIDGYPNKTTLLLSKILPKKLVLNLTGKVVETIYKKGNS